MNLVAIGLAIENELDHHKINDQIFHVFYHYTKQPKFFDHQLLVATISD
jgi:hypothetical protein